jgi:hypothetical protein
MVSLLASLEEKLFGRKQVARCARWFSCGRESRARTYRGMRRMKKMSVVALTLLLFVLESNHADPMGSRNSVTVWRHV